MIMTAVKLFEIFVYPFDKDTYYKKWDFDKESFIRHQIDTENISYDEGLESFKRAYGDVYNFGYNKICGIISIYYDYITGNIKYDVYKQDRNIYNKKVILRLEKICGPNLHDYVRGKNNDEIISIIDSKLNYIKKVLLKNKYIDLECYDNLKHNIDFVKIIKGSD